MSKFYRNRRGFFAALGKSGVYLAAGITGLILLSLGALLIAPEEPEMEALAPMDTSQISTEPVTETVQTDASSFLPSDSEESTDAPADTKPAPEVEDVTMILPVSGTVGTEFSVTVPVFSQTMNDWRVHQGIDFCTEEPSDVLAAADGIVDQIYTDELMGLTVEILHVDGTLSVYQSLSEEIPVIAGQQVLQGDVIGQTGTSADCELLEGNHLHFALIREGIYLDPEDRFIS